MGTRSSTLQLWGHMHWAVGAVRSYLNQQQSSATMPLLAAHAAALMVILNLLADSAEPDLLQLSLKSLRVWK